MDINFKILQSKYFTDQIFLIIFLILNFYLFFILLIFINSSFHWTQKIAAIVHPVKHRQCTYLNKAKSLACPVQKMMSRKCLLTKMFI